MKILSSSIRRGEILKYGFGPSGLNLAGRGGTVAGAMKDAPQARSEAAYIAAVAAWDLADKISCVLRSALRGPHIKRLRCLLLKF